MHFETSGPPFFDEAINEILDFEFEVDHAADKRMIDEPFVKVWPSIIEYPISGKENRLLEIIEPERLV